MLERKAGFGLWGTELVRPGGLFVLLCAVIEGLLLRREEV